MSTVTYSDLKYARGLLNKRARRAFPENRSLDAHTPAVKSGLVVVEFEVAGTVEFAREVMQANADRVLNARKQYGLDLFAACYMSGLAVGALTEQER